MLKIYQLLTVLLTPVIKIYLFKRKLKGKEDSGRFKERLGYASLPRSVGKLAWIHAASVGESISILPLIEQLSTKFPKLNFLVTTGTVTSAKLMATRLPDCAIHQYIPVDILTAVQRFLKHWQPDIAIFAESEIWPNIITQTGKTCPLIMVNGHISEQSFRNWSRDANFAREIFSAYSLCLTQSETDAGYIKKLGAANVKFAGNIKYSAAPLSVDEKELADLKEMIGSRHLWVAASTHFEGESEELLVASVHKELKEKHPGLLTIIIPRHPSRKDEILSELSKMQLKIAVRSHGDKITGDTDIYLGDTMGELGMFYHLSDIAFVGGSLVKRGGHNPLEPARLGCAIIVGPHSFNFTEINNEFIKKNAIITVTNASELTQTIDNLLKDNKKMASYINAAYEVVNDNNGIVEKVIGEISPYIKMPS